MNRVVIPLAVLALAGGVYFLLSYRPQGGQVKPNAPASQAPGPALTDAEVPPGPRPVQPASGASEAPPSAPAAAAETGPFEMFMNDNKISMRDSKKRMRMSIVLTTDNPVTLRELRGLREDLRRMIYFLSAHRSEESMVGDAGKARFLEDLRERFKNKVRTGNLDRVEITTWELEDAPPAAPPTLPDDGPASVGDQK